MWCALLTLDHSLAVIIMYTHLTLHSNAWNFSILNHFHFSCFCFYFLHWESYFFFCSDWFTLLFTILCNILFLGWSESIQHGPYITTKSKHFSFSIHKRVLTESTLTSHCICVSLDWLSRPHADSLTHSQTHLLTDVIVILILCVTKSPLDKLCIDGALNEY